MNAEQILVTMFTGNFGYGVIGFIFVVIYFVWKMFVQPGLARKDELEIDLESSEKLHKEDIRAKETQIQEIQKMLEDAHNTISEQQSTMAKLTSINEEKDVLVKNITANDSLVTNVTKLDTSIRELLEHMEEQMQTNNKTIASMVDEIEEKVLPKLDESGERIAEAFRTFEQTIQSMSQNRLSQHEEMSSATAKILTGMGELRSMFAARGMSDAVQAGSNDKALDSALQQVK